MEPNLKDQILQLLRSDDGKEIIDVIIERSHIKSSREGVDFLLGLPDNEKVTENP